MPCYCPDINPEEEVRRLEGKIEKYEAALRIPELREENLMHRRSVQYFKEEADKATSLLCGLMQALEDAFGAPENKEIKSINGYITINDDLNNWWLQHKEYDAKRIEKEKQDKIAMKQAKEKMLTDKISELQNQLEGIRNEN